MSEWYARPVLFVSDIDKASRFYVDRLGFSEPWRHGENGEPLVAQVDRAGCELILSSQWPEKVGNGLIFISLRSNDLRTARDEFESRGVDVKDGWWGYPLMIIEDPDGNLLYFPSEADAHSDS
jgi:catechol 2,3-dioxygenase-like lactoylglutathione lyase family enzyme